MATYEITSPDGKTFEINAPDGASESDVLAFAQSKFSARQKALEEDRKKYDPAAGMSAVERGLVGAGSALRNAYLGVRGLIPGQGLTDEEKDELQTYERFRGNLGTAGKVGEIGGNVALLAAPGAGALRGVRAVGRAAQAARALPGAARAAGRVAANRFGAAGISGAGLGAATAPEDRGSAALGGAVGGVLGEGVGSVLTRTLGGISGATDAARRLMAQGVDVPVWKATDLPALRRIAEAAKALPLAGPAIRQAEGNAIRDYNRTLVRGATAPRPVLDEAGSVLRWEETPIEQVGQEGLQALGNRFGEAYDALYRSRGGIPIDDAYTNAAQGELARVRNYLPRIADDVEGAFRQADDTLRAGTEPTVTRSPIVDASGRPFVNEQLGHATVPSGNVQQAIAQLDDAINTAWRQGDQERAQALSFLRDEIGALRTRGLPPESQGMQQAVNDAYSNFKTLQRAGSSLGAARADGVVTPRQVISAVKARDRSPDKSLFASGRARGQRAAQEAEEVLGSELPDVGPGTAEKLLPWLTYGGGLGLPALGYDSGAWLLLGTPQGQRALRGDYALQGGIRRAAPSITDWLRTFGTAQGAN